MLSPYGIVLINLFEYIIEAPDAPLEQTELKASWIIDAKNDDCYIFRLLNSVKIRLFLIYFIKISIE